MKKSLVFISLLILIFTYGCASKFEGLKKEADAGDPVKQFEVAQSYWGGYGVKKDKNIAMKYYKLSSNQGYARAKHQLGKVYILRKENDKALKLIEEAAKQGDDRAQGHFGSLYYKAKIVKKDLKKAKYWLKKSFAQNNMGSGFELSIVHTMEKDFQKSRNCLKTVVYCKPEQLSNRIKIICLMLLADAEYKLKNKVEAFAWYNVATVSDVFVIKPQLAYVIKTFEKLRDELSTEEKNQAASLALKYHQQTMVQHKHYFKNKNFPVYRNTYFLPGSNWVGFFGAFFSLNRETMAAVDHYKKKKDKNSQINYSFYSRKLAVKRLEYGSIRSEYYKALKLLEESYNVIKGFKDKKYKYAQAVTLAQLKTVKSLVDAQEKIWISWNLEKKNK
ncbi:MAG: sel1 repeat family protein [Deltaproteobacteria bacterium]|nr:sel1 repeat family protein [Deltaproteobacteria bacterium]